MGGMEVVRSSGLKWIGALFEVVDNSFDAKRSELPQDDEYLILPLHILRLTNSIHRKQKRS